MGEAFDPYHVWLGIPPTEQPANHYRLLGIALFESDPSVIESAVDRQMIHLRTFQLSKYAQLSEKLLNEVAAAKICLLLPERKAAYDRQLRRQLQDAADASQRPEIDSQLALALKQEAQKGLRHPRQRPKLGHGALLGAASAVAALALIVAVWSVAARKAPPQTAQHAAVPEKESRNVALSDASAVPASPPNGTGSNKSPPGVPVSPLPVPGATPKPSVAEQSPGGKTRPAKQVKKPTDADRIAAPETLPRPKETDHVPDVARTARTPAHVAQPSAVAKHYNPGRVPLQASPAVSGHAPAAAASEPTLLPVPTDEAREAAAKLAQDVYRSDYASAKSAAGKQALAKRILDDALKVRNDATQRYVLLFLARDVAIAGQDEKAAFQAIGELGRTYSIDPWAMKAEAMQHLAKGSHPPAAHRELAGRALALAEEAIEADKFSVADAMAKLALADAGKVRDKELVQRSRALVKEGQETATAFAAIEEASIILRENPADPAANLAVGKYLCFTKGGWPKGLLHLTKSNDAGLKSLADDERRNTPPWEPAPGVVPPDPPPASVALRLADGWWEAGQTVLGKQHDRILLHAGYWYNQSFGSDIASLVATKISTRLEQIEKIRRQYPAPPLAIAPFDASEAREHQRRWADYLGVPVVMANSMGMKLVLVPPGEFEMGSNEEEIDFCRRIGENRNESKYYFIGLQGEGPRHHIRMIKPYYLGMFEVTQGEFEALLRFNPSAYAHNGTRKNAVAGTETRLFPVESVTWHECVTLCRKLGDLPAERASGRGYRMPTEAEWEYACRAGSATLWPYGNEEPTKPPYFSAVGHAVGRTESNPWRLYDMLGSVAEWCADYWDPQYYRNSPTVAPTGATIGATRVVRGVGFGPLFCRPAFRYNYMPDARRDYCGFRVLCFLSEPVTR